MVVSHVLPTYLGDPDLRGRDGATGRRVGAARCDNIVCRYGVVPPHEILVYMCRGLYPPPRWAVSNRTQPLFQDSALEVDGTARRYTSVIEYWVVDRSYRRRQG